LVSAAPLKALLVAAGVGSRLRPLTDVLPKCLMPVNGRPLLGFWLSLLARAGIGEVIVNLHHHAELVRAFVSRSPYAPITTLAHEETLLGTGGTLLRHREKLAGGPVFFAYADNLSVFDLRRFLDVHENRPAGVVMTMMTFETDRPSQCGVVELDQSGVVVGFHEKSQAPPGNLANAAVFILEPEVLDVLASIQSPFIDFSADVIPRFLGRIQTYHNAVYHRDIGSPVSYLRAQLEYPLVEGARSAGDGDPWYGLMGEPQSTLAQDLMRAIDRMIPETRQYAVRQPK
jgi:mannose-1-phosphate guanylyltransferase